MATYLSDEALQKAMLHGLEDHVRAALREKFEAVSKPVIEEAITAAMQTFEVAVMKSFDISMGGPIVGVILRDERSGGSPS